MTARILPPEEWSRLDPGRVPPLFLHCPPGDADVVVVEDEKGSIIGTVTVLKATHLECLWIEADHRNAGVARSLLRKACEVAAERGSTWVLGNSADEQMQGIMRRLGGQPFAAPFYLLPIGS